MKVFTTTTLVVVLTFIVSVKGHTARKTNSNEKVNIKTHENAKININEKDSNDKEKYKRGIFYNGLGSLSSHYELSSHLPHAYASHYGYNLHLPGSTSFSSGHLAATPSIAYGHTHFKTGFAGLPVATAYNSAAVHHTRLAHAPFAASAVSEPWPHVHNLAPTYAAAHTHFAHTPFAAPAVPESWPHAHSLAPTYAAAAAPALPHAHLAHTTFATSAVPESWPHAHNNLAHTYAAAVAPEVWPQANVAEYAFSAAAPSPVHAHAVAAAPVHTPPYVLRSGGAVVSSYSANYPRHRPVVAIQPAPPAPVQPVHPVVHVQAFRPVQTIQPVHAVQPIQHVQPIQPAVQEIPTFSFPAPAPVPAVPAAPVIPAAPAVPAAPVIPAVAPPRPFIPVQPQPNPLPSFPNPPLNPVPNFPNPPPDGGSAVASPQIPAQLPQPTEAPWKPVAVDRPSITLMPPYGAPGEAYLPPAAPSQELQQQQEQQQLNSLFDNLTEAEIEHIFSQAAQAQQQHQQQYRHQNRNGAYRHRF